MEENYILPSELIILFIVWYLPPILICTIIQVCHFKNKGLFNSSKYKTLFAIFSTPMISVIIGVLLLPIQIPRWLSASNDLFILPLAFIIVFTVGYIFSAWVVKYKNVHT